MQPEQDALAEEVAPEAGEVAPEAGEAEPVTVAVDGPSVEAASGQALVEDVGGAEADGLDTLPFFFGGGLLLLGALAVAVARGGGRSKVPEVAEQVIAPGTPVLPARPAPAGLAARLRERMARTQAAMQARFDTLFGGDRVDEDTLEGLEEALIIADVGVPTTERILDHLRALMRGGMDDPVALREAMRAHVRETLHATHRPFTIPADRKPFVLLVVGVNGSGKTTTIGKLAARFTSEGRKVLLAAGDTYRAAAAEQLEIWAQRAGADIVRHAEGADPGAVVFDALDAALARDVDVVIVDTAGRLQTARPLMEQLTKVRRVMAKKVPDAPHDTLLVLDGTMGQNAMSQARNFHEATPLSGVVVTKLDGTAKGGMVLAIASEMRLPVAFLGIGEQVDDLRPFEVEGFVDALL